MDFEAISRDCPWRDCTACVAQIDLTPVPKRRKCVEHNCAFMHWQKHGKEQNSEARP